MKRIVMCILLVVAMTASLMPAHSGLPATTIPLASSHLARISGGELSFLCGFGIALAIGGYFSGNIFLVYHGATVAFEFCSR